MFYKIFKENKPGYFFNLIPTKNSNHNTRNTDKITLFHTKHNFFQKFFFFHPLFLKFIRLSTNSVFNCHNCKWIKYLPRLRFDLSHLREHKFKYSFQDTLNPVCSFGLDVERNMHFSLHCPCLVIKDEPSWAQLMILIVVWQILMIRYWLIFFFLVKLLKIYEQTPSYLMQQLYHTIISYQQRDLKRVYFVNFCYIFISLNFFSVSLSFFLRLYIHIH